MIAGLFYEPIPEETMGGNLATFRDQASER
jgi:hypothetical protein